MPDLPPIVGELKITADRALGTLDYIKEKVTQLRETPAQLDVKADIAKAEAALDEIKAKADELEGRHPDIKIGAEAEEAKRKLDEIVMEVDRIRMETASPRVALNVQRYQETYEKVIAEQHFLDSQEATIKIKGDDKDLEEKLARAELATAIFNKAGDASSGGAASGAAGDMENLVGALGPSPSESMSPAIHQAILRSNRAADKLNVGDVPAGFYGPNPSEAMSPAIYQAIKKQNAVEDRAAADMEQARLASLPPPPKPPKPPDGPDWPKSGASGEGEGMFGGALSGTAGLSSSMQTAMSDAGQLSMKLFALGPVGAGAFSVIAGSAMALPGVFAGVGGALTMLYSGLHNVISAIQAYTNAQQTAGMAGAQMGANANASAMQIRQAQQAVLISDQQVSHTIEQNAYNVKLAKQAVAQAIMSASNSERSANQQVIISEQQLQSATSSYTLAQRNMQQAVMDATFSLINYHNQLADGALQTKQDILNVKQAQYNLNMVMGDPSATNLQRQQAQLSYQEAVQQLHDQRDSYKQLQATAELAFKRGVQGSTEVMQAEQSLTQAVYAVKDAHFAVIDAAIAQAQTEKWSAITVQDAWLALHQTQLQGNWSLQSAQLSSTMATQQLSFAIKQAGLTAGAMNTSFTQLALAMSLLSPAGKAFVTWWGTEMHPILHQLGETSQTALLPGLRKGLEELVPYLKVWAPVIKEMATGFDNFFQSVAKFLSSKTGLSEFSKTMHSAAGFMGDFGKAIVDVMKGLGAIGAGAGTAALKEIGSVVDKIAHHFATWASGTGPIGVMNEFMKVAPLMGKVFNSATIPALIGAKYFGVLGFAIGMFHKQLLPLLAPLMQLASEFIKIISADIGPVIQSVAIALGPVLNALQPVLKPLGELVAKLILTAGLDLAPVLQGIADALGPILTSIQPLIPPLGQLAALVGSVLVTAFHAIVPIFQAVMPVLAGVIRQLAHELAPILKALEPVLTALGPLIGQVLVLAIKELSTPLQLLLPLITPIVQALGPALTTIITSLTPVVQQLSTMFSTTFMPAITALAQPLGTMIGQFASIFAKLGATVIQAVLVAVTSLLTAMGQVLPPLVKAMAPLITQFGTLFTNLTPLITPMTNLVTTLIKDLMPYVPGLVKAMTPFLALFTSGLVVIINGITSGMQAINAALKWMLNNVGSVTNALQPFFSLIQTMLGPLEKIYGFIFGANNAYNGPTGNPGSAVAPQPPNPNPPKKHHKKRAAGGDVTPDEWYLVGEDGPELFAPGLSGTIIPNHGSSGSFSPNLSRGGGGPAQIVLQIDGYTFAQALFPDLWTVLLERKRALVKLGLS